MSALLQVAEQNINNIRRLAADREGEGWNLIDVKDGVCSPML